MISTAVTVATTATVIVAADNQNRRVYVHNSGGAKIYLGGSTVTTSNGYHLGNDENIDIFVPLNEALYAVVASGTNVVIVLTPNLD